MEENNNKTLTSLDYLKKVSLNNEAFIKEMITIFLRQTPQLLEALKDASNKEDWVAFRAIVHKLKPSLQMMGINSALPLIPLIERTSKLEKEIDLFPQRLEQLCHICTLSMKELKNKQKDL